MSATLFEAWVTLGAVVVGAEVCENGIKLHWESQDGKDGGMQMLSDWQARQFYNALQKVMGR